MARGLSLDFWNTERIDLALLSAGIGLGGLLVVRAEQIGDLAGARAAQQQQPDVEGVAKVQARVGRRNHRRHAKPEPSHDRPPDW